MGLFGALFGKNDKSVGKDEIRIIRLLFGMRILYQIRALGYVEQEAEAISIAKVEEMKLSDVEIQHIPETVILSICRDYSRILSENVNEANRRKINLDLVRGKRLIIEAIEANRNSLLGFDTIDDYPRVLDDYIYYRICREIKNINGVNPDEMGFTYSAVQAMTKFTKGMYQQKTPCPL